MPWLRAARIDAASKDSGSRPAPSSNRTLRVSAHARGVARSYFVLPHQRTADRQRNPSILRRAHKFCCWRKAIRFRPFASLAGCDRRDSWLRAGFGSVEGFEGTTARTGRKPCVKRYLLSGEARLQLTGKTSRSRDYPEKNYKPTYCARRATACSRVRLHDCS